MHVVTTNDMELGFQALMPVFNVLHLNVDAQHGIFQFFSHFLLSCCKIT